MKTNESLIPIKKLHLANFIIDTIVYLIIISVIIWILRNTIDQYYIRYISIVIYFLYYFLFEYIIGQTPGKMITRTRVFYNHQDLRIIMLILRTFSRFIPLDIISYLFFKRGLHDWISKTNLIKKQ